MIEKAAFWYVNYIEPFSTILLFVLFILFVLWFFFLLQDLSRLNTLVSSIFKGLGTAVILTVKFLVKLFTFSFTSVKRVISVFFATVRDFFVSKV